MIDEIDQVTEAQARAQDIYERGAARRRAAGPEARVVSDACIECGDDIPAARREALPYALRCVGCAADAER